MEDAGAAAHATVAQAGFPDHRTVRRGRSAGRVTSRLWRSSSWASGSGFDSAWVRHRHLQYGISSPVAVLAAASQRTRRIELGTAVIPLGWENPLRLAEDLATVDLLSGGRLNPGVSVGPPMHYDRSSRRSTRTRPRSRTSATGGCSGCWTSCAASRPPTSAGSRASRCSPTGSSRTSAGSGPADVVRRGQPALGPVGRRARDELPDQQRGARPRSRRTSPRSSCPTSGRSGPTTPTATGPGSRQGLVVIPTDSASRRAAGQVRRVRRSSGPRARPPRRARPG